MLNGEKVVLRAVDDGDLDVLVAIGTEAAVWEERTPGPLRPLTRDAVVERIRAKLADTGPDALFVVEVDGVAVGQCELFAVSEVSRNAEVGIALAAGARGRGFGTDALRTLVRYAFERRNLHRVHLTALASNAAGIGCYRRVGFVEEGRRRESAWVRGAYEDEICMGLLRSEWAG